MRSIRRSLTTWFAACAMASCAVTPIAAQERPATSSKKDVLDGLKMPVLRGKRSQKSSEEAKFELVRGEGRIYFSLVAGEDVLLRSPGYATDRAITEAMERVVTHIKRVRDMPMRQLKSGEYYFVVIGQRDEVLATSPLYATKEEARQMRDRIKGVDVKEKPGVTE